MPALRRTSPWLALSLACSVSFLAQSSIAADLLTLTWDQCGAAGTPTKTFDCDDNTPTHQLYLAFSLGQALDDVVGIEAVVDIQHSAEVMPDWWRLGVGGCRQGELDANGAAPVGECADFWLGEATDHGIQGYTVGQPRGAPNQARIKVALALLPGSARSLNANDVYFAARILLGTDRTTSTGACEGCSGAACLVLNSIILRRLPGAPGGDRFIQTASSAGNLAVWQPGGGALCGTVPVRRNTWGQIKAIYR